jgi:hypothetical protein
MSAAFLAAKAALCKSVSLAHPSATAELALMVDALGKHVGASLQHRAAAGWSRPRPATRRLTGIYWPVSPHQAFLDARLVQNIRPLDSKAVQASQIVHRRTYQRHPPHLRSG